MNKIIAVFYLDAPDVIAPMIVTDGLFEDIVSIREACCDSEAHGSVWGGFASRESGEWGGRVVEGSGAYIRIGRRQWCGLGQLKQSLRFDPPMRVCFTTGGGIFSRNGETKKSLSTSIA